MYPFTDVCELVHFINKNGGDVSDEQGGQLIDQINAGAKQADCPGGTDASVVAPAPASSGSSELPDTGDSAESQGAPSTTPQATIDLECARYGEPGDPRHPTQALHDYRNPQSEGEIRDRRAVPPGRRAGSSAAENDQ